MRTSTLICLCLFVAALSAGCAEGAGAGTNTPTAPEPANNNPDEGQNNEIPPLADPVDLDAPEEGLYIPPHDETFRPPVNDRNSLEIVGEPEIGLNYVGGAELQVRLLDPRGDIVRGGQVRFDFDGPSADLTLDDHEAPTNRNGIARTVVNTDRTSGTYRIVVTADLADPVFFTLHVAPKDRASYVVHTEYEGHTQPALVSVRLFDDSFDCNDLDPHALFLEFDRFDVIPTPEGIPDARFIELPNGDGYTVVSLGLMPETAHAAFGCNDDRAPINDGFDTEVTVVMEELLPELVGVYDIETRVDLTDALPEPWRTNINLIGRIFADPASLVVDLIIGAEDDPNDDGLIGDVLGIIPGIRGLLTQVINDLLGQVISEEVRRVFDVGGAVYNVVTRFTLGGQLEIVREADPQGFLATHNEHRYGSIIVLWDIDCTDQDPPDCGRIEISMNDLERFGALSGQFAGQLVLTEDHGDYLHVDAHTLSFNYGALVLALFEQLVLPAIFGDHVNSLGDALREMIDCRDISDGVFDPVNEALLNELLFNSCNETVDSMESLLVEMIVANNVAIPNLSIGTFEAFDDDEYARVGCQIAEPSPYAEGVLRRRYIHLGTEETRCQWDARLETGDEVRRLDADFFGGR